MDGLRELCTALGLRTPTALSTVHIRYPYQHGVAEYELRLELLQQLWKNMLKGARRS